VGATGLSGLWALEWVWHICVTNFDSFRDIRVHIYDFLKFVGGLWAIGIDENNIFQ